MIVFKSKWLTLGTVWFDEKPTTAKVDVIRYQHRKERLVGAESKEVYTLVNDLTKSPDDLLSAMPKDTRYERRRATEQDKINCQHWNRNLAHPLARFINFYDECAERKNIPRAPAAYLRVMADAGVLDLS